MKQKKASYNLAAKGLRPFLPSCLIPSESSAPRGTSFAITHPRLRLRAELDLAYGQMEPAAPDFTRHFVCDSSATAIRCGKAGVASRSQGLRTLRCKVAVSVRPMKASCFTAQKGAAKQLAKVEVDHG